MTLILRQNSCCLFDLVFFAHECCELGRLGHILAWQLLDVVELGERSVGEDDLFVGGLCGFHLEGNNLVEAIKIIVLKQ